MRPDPVTQVQTHDTTLHAGFARQRIIAIGVGGALGAVARAWLGRHWPSGAGWPWGTFVANLAGTAILAWFFAYLIVPVHRQRLWRLFVGTGFCGALTTFGTLQIEVIDLAKHSDLGLGIAYAIVSLVAGLAVAVGAAALGRGTARR